MAELTDGDRIWNRACGSDQLRTLPGDCALADMLRAHNLTMNGGVLHAVECLTASELADAEAGYRFYGLGEVSLLFTKARSLFEVDDELEDHELLLDRRYAALVPTDSFLADCFETRLRSNPSEFAPLRPQDMD